MRKRSLTLPVLVAAFCALPLAADLIVVSTTEVDGLGQSGEGRTVTKISGLKSRSESDVGRHASVTLLDLEKREMVIINEKKKRAEVFDLASMATQQVDLETREFTLEPTGNTRQAAGYSCEDHTIDGRIDAGMEGMNLEVVLGGVVCLSEEAPGREESMAFYREMAERGLFFGDPNAAQAQPGRERGMTELYRKMSEMGVPLISDLEIRFDGKGPMAAMMRRMKVSTTSTVESISTDDVPASDFSLDGYKVKQN